MQSTSFQSAPCASPEEAAASAAAMAALSAPSGMEHKIVKTIVQEVNGLFVAVVVVELVEIGNEAEAEAEARPAEHHQDEPIYGENDAPDNIYWIAGFNAHQMEEFQPFPDVGDTALHPPAVPDTAPDTAVAATPQDAYDDSYYMSGLYYQDTQTGPDSLLGNAQLAEQVIIGFNEEPAAPAATQAPPIAPDQTDRGEGDGGDGEGGDGGKGRRRDPAKGLRQRVAEEPAPAPPA
ncbi:MAG TPA: hypothetical protein VFS88_06370 [Micavibrio sp.]|nr:hypothetical protein [Micavibrio sp.]